jgi:hypothetical protein
MALMEAELLNLSLAFRGLSDEDGDEVEKDADLEDGEEDDDDDLDADGAKDDDDDGAVIE